MQDKSTILMRRVGVKTEKSGWLGRETHLVLDGKCGDSEVLCAVGKDGANARVVKVDENGWFVDGQAPTAEELLFVVRRTPFDVDMMISAGKDSDGYEWFFNVGGKLAIVAPEVFAAKLRGDVEPGESLEVWSFVKQLGTIPTTVLHDKVTVDVFGVMSFEDKGAEDQYVDIRQSLEAWRLVNENYVASAVGGAFDAFFKVQGVVKFDASMFRAFSPKREEDDARKRKSDQDEIRNAMNRKAQDEKRAEEIAEKRHEQDLLELDVQKKIREKECELKLAELEAQKKKLQDGDGVAATAAFEAISNLLGDLVSKTGTGAFSALLKDARRAEAGLRVLALAKDKKRDGGVVLEKRQPSFQVRALSFTSKKTPVLHFKETLASVVACGREGGCLTLLNVSEQNEIIPLLPNADFPVVRIAKGERILVGDEASAYIGEIHEEASSGTDNLVAIVSDEPVLESPLPPFGASLSSTAAAELVAKLESMDGGAWAADIISFVILP